jgi:ATP-grasp domain
VELVVGGHVDPLFGPIVVVGLGGIFVEALDDSLFVACGGRRMPPSWVNSWRPTCVLLAEGRN